MADRLVYRSIGETGERYPEWLRDLDQESGVYLIRIDGELVYVGESHTDRLYQTITRHFQRWTRRKTHWRGRSGPHDPGMRYHREGAKVAFRITSPENAVEDQYELIRRLKPRDNLFDGSTLDEEVPF